jgi:hypothetical protein
VNEAQQQTNDFFLIRTFDRNGTLVHLKTQLKDILENTYVYDYDVAYAVNKIVLSGKTIQTNWTLDDPEDLSPDPAIHFTGSEVISTKNIEIFLDAKAKYPVEVRHARSPRPLMTLQYDRHHFLDSVHVFVYDKENLAYVLDFNVTTDAWGNIVSIHENADPQTIEKFGYLGVEYAYAEGAPSHRHEFYETPNIFIDPMFNLLEVLDIGPFQPNRQRIGGSISWIYPPDEINIDTYIEFSYRDHVYDRKGNLINYTFDGEFGRIFAPGASHFGQRLRTIRWADLQQ